MKVILKPETLVWLNEKVDSGEFGSVSEAIDMLVEQEREMEEDLAQLDPSLSPEELAERLVEIAGGRGLLDLDAEDADVDAQPKPKPVEKKKPRKT